MTREMVHRKISPRFGSGERFLLPGKHKGIRENIDFRISEPTRWMIISDRREEK